MGITLTDVLLFGKAQSDDVDNATLVIYRRNILRWSALGGYLDIIVKGVSPLSLPDAIANSLSYVKAFGGTEQRDIPDNYLQRQFIYMMDGSYIKVEDLPISAGYRVEFDFQTLTLSSPLRNYLGGRANGVSAGGGFRLTKLASSNNNRVVLYGFESGTEYYDPTTQFQPNTRYKYTYNNGVCTLETGGSVVSTRTFTVTDDTSANWGINAYTNGSTWQTDSDGIYVYSVKVWNTQGELVMDLVPAVQKGTVPVVGFYDTVSKTFKTATTGTFAAGGEAVPTPDTPMDIVSNNGVLKLSPNLVDFNEVRINGTTWASADKTKGFEVEAAVYGKDVGSSVISNANCFGVFVPCKQGESVSINFFDYTVYGARCYYCEVDANGVATTTPVQYATNQNVLTQQTFTITQSNSIGFVIEWYITSGQVRNYTKENYMVVRGATPPTAYIPYGQIYTDGTVETIQITGKNIFNKNNLTRIYGYFAATGGNWVYVSTGYSIRIPCLPNTTYTARYNGNSTQAVLSFASTSSDKTPTAATPVVVTNSIRQNSPTINTPITITTGASDKWLIVAYNVAEPENTDMANNLQIERGSTATDYVPYFNGGTATAEMLLKISDYADQQEIVDGTVTRKVGIKVLDGTENWVFSTTWLNYMYSLEVNDLYAEASSVASNRKSPYCTHFGRSENWLGGSARANMVQAYQPTTGDAILGLGYGTPSTANLAAFKQWLADQYAAGTPVIVIYPLATPTTESVAGQALQVTDGDNVLEITQASLNNLELEAEYQAAVSLTIQEVQDANLDPNVEVTIN